MFFFIFFQPLAIVTYRHGLLLSHFDETDPFQYSEVVDFIQVSSHVVTPAYKFKSVSHIPYINVDTMSCMRLHLCRFFANFSI